LSHSSNTESITFDSVRYPCNVWDDDGDGDGDGDNDYDDDDDDDGKYVKPQRVRLWVCSWQMFTPGMTVLQFTMSTFKVLVSCNNHSDGIFDIYI